MALANTETTTLATLTPQSLGSNPAVRMLGIMLAIAASIALGITTVLWFWVPNYTVLFGGLTQNDAKEIVDALQQGQIPFKVDEATGAVMVPSQKLHEVRLKLAGQGLPRGDGLGFELLQQETGFGTSRSMESARFQRAQEGELARTISTLSSVETARVHLAIPKQSVFVRQRKQSSASVALKLFPGRTLEKAQVAAILHLVASSVPELEPERVTVVDQKGNLLSAQSDTREMMLTASQFEYTTQLEEHYRNRIETLLAAMVGPDSVRAQISADVDFTVTEQSQESFNPEGVAVRSEQVNEEQRSANGAQGIPGALSNQPAAAGFAPETGAGAGAETPPGAGVPLNSSRQATRNFEVDKTISHSRLSTGNLRRLSIAVVVDDTVTVTGKGKKQTIERQPRTPEELERITQLVKETVGFNAERGDTVRVVNAAFHVLPEPAALPEPPLWEQPWFWDVVQKVGAVALFLVLVFVVLLPTIKRLLATPPPRPLPAGALAAQSLDHMPATKLPGPGRYEDTIDAARAMVQEDPKRVAQVVKQWVANDAGS